MARSLGKSVFLIVFTPDDKKIVGPELRDIQVAFWDQDGQSQLGQRLGEIASEIARGYRFDKNRSPWPGILAFEAEDAAVFFGRDAEIRRVAELLEVRRLYGGTRLLFLVGGSGSGKSSLLRAGVLPFIGRDPQKFIPFPPFRPGLTPLAALAKAFAHRLGDATEWQKYLGDFRSDRAAERVARLCEELRVGERHEAVVVVPVDRSRSCSRWRLSKSGKLSCRCFPCSQTVVSQYQPLCGHYPH